MMALFLPTLSAKKPPRKFPAIIATLLTATIIPINAVVASIVTARDFTKKITAEPETIELANVVKNTMTSNRTKFRDAGTFESTDWSVVLDIIHRLKILTTHSTTLLSPSQT